MENPSTSYDGCFIKGDMLQSQLGVSSCYNPERMNLHDFIPRSKRMPLTLSFISTIFFEHPSLLSAINGHPPRSIVCGSTCPHVFHCCRACCHLCRCGLQRRSSHLRVPSAALHTQGTFVDAPHNMKAHLGRSPVLSINPE